MKRKLISITLAMVLCFSLALSTGAATKVKLNSKSITLEVKKTFKLKVKGKKIKKKKFKTTDKKVATVNKKGVVTAVNEGTCKIKVVVKLKNKKTKKLTCKVTVVKKLVPNKVEPTKKPAETTVPTTKQEPTTTQISTGLGSEDFDIQIPTRKPRETTTPAETTEKPSNNTPEINM